MSLGGRIESIIYIEEFTPPKIFQKTAPLPSAPHLLGSWPIGEQEQLRHAILRAPRVEDVPVVYRNPPARAITWGNEALQGPLAHSQDLLAAGVRQIGRAAAGRWRTIRQGCKRLRTPASVSI